MPVKRRLPKRREGLDDDALAWLRGQSPVWEYFERPDDIAAMWQANRDWVVDEWVAKSPGTRPPLWWRFEAPAGPDPDETDAAYLARNGLFRAGERRRVADRRPVKLRAGESEPPS